MRSSPPFTLSLCVTPGKAVGRPCSVRTQWPQRAGPSVQVSPESPSWTDSTHGISRTTADFVGGWGSRVLSGHCPCSVGCSDLVSGALGVLTSLSLHAGVDKERWPNRDCHLKGTTRRLGLFSGRRRAPEWPHTGGLRGVLMGGRGDGVTQRPRCPHSQLSCHYSSHPMVLKGHASLTFFLICVTDKGPMSNSGSNLKTQADAIVHLVALNLSGGEMTVGQC